MYEVIKDSTSFADLELHLPDIEISSFRVVGHTSLVGKTLSQIGLRKKYGLTLLAIRRNSHILSNPGGDIEICANDVLILLGAPDKIAKIMSLFSNMGKFNKDS